MGHVCRLPSNSITRKAPRWTPQGERTTKEMWWCTIEKDPNIRGMSLHMAPEQQQTEPDGTCPPLALKLHHQKSPQMDTSGREKERTTKEMWWCTVEKDPNIRGMSLHMAQEQQQTEPDGTCPPLALKLHHQKSPQMDTSGREDDQRDVVVHH